MSTLHQVYLTYDIELNQLKEANGLEGNPEPHNTTPVITGDRIHWQPAASNSNIASITSIVPAPSPDVLFSSPPTEQNEWTGEISQDASVGDYNYNISFMPISGGVVEIKDPKIKVNPGTPGS